MSSARCTGASRSARSSAAAQLHSKLHPELSLNPSTDITSAATPLVLTPFLRNQSCQPAGASRSARSSWSACRPSRGQRTCSRRPGNNNDRHQQTNNTHSTTTAAAAATATTTTTNNYDNSNNTHAAHNNNITILLILTVTITKQQQLLLLHILIIIVLYYYK